MAMRAAAVQTTSALAPRGLWALYSSFTSGFPFNLPQTQTEKAPPVEPSTNLFVSGLSKRTTTEGLQNAFAKFAKVVTDRVSGYSKGYGFVRYATIEEAAAGIKGMDGQFLDGWVIFSENARPRPPPPSLNNAQTYNQP
ncbi:glycine-rich RNA-binding 3, mitochondrial [Olea europaea subsp. europaea]|uniref:Glycine-rich RNA-binding 3, mitochondrial n=1 Tax=Olea europaea subsp. europaea TaxID=158383 RepID=A0A8S0TBD4_OLEEU|nr:glycine-rich RNA-binding 3, mitochondrial [Olea europaea subsp. europaea]